MLNIFFLVACRPTNSLRAQVALAEGNGEVAAGPAAVEGAAPAGGDEVTEFDVAPSVHHLPSAPPPPPVFGLVPPGAHAPLQDNEFDAAPSAIDLAGAEVSDAILGQFCSFESHASGACGLRVTCPVHGLPCRKFVALHEHSGQLGPTTARWMLEYWLTLAGTMGPSDHRTMRMDTVVAEAAAYMRREKGL